MFRLTIVLALLPVMLVAGPSSGLPPSVDIPRFQMMAEGLYRGGQPDKTGFEYLKQKGIKTIINLRMEDDEALIVKALGMNYVQIPMDVNPWSKISDASIKKYFEIVNNPENYPIFFHCRRGADRTGVMAGFYRIAVQGWDWAKAYNEARQIGMRWWYAGLKDQLQNFRSTLVVPANSQPVTQKP